MCVIHLLTSNELSQRFIKCRPCFSVGDLRWVLSMLISAKDVQCCWLVLLWCASVGDLLSTCLCASVWRVGLALNKLVNFCCYQYQVARCIADPCCLVYKLWMVALFADTWPTWCFNLLGLPVWREAIIMHSCLNMPTMLLFTFVDLSKKLVGLKQLSGCSLIRWLTDIHVEN